jgi:anti-sigma B factor antagonist
MASAELSTRERNGQVVVTLSGELDVADAARVAAELAVIAASRRQIVVDLAALDFIDSSGLAALVRTRHLVRSTGFDMLLAAPRPQVLRMLAITRLVEVFTIHTCVDEATGIPMRRHRRGIGRAAGSRLDSLIRGRHGQARAPARARATAPPAE